MTDDNIVNLNGKKPKRPPTSPRQAHFDKLGHAPAGGHQASGPGWGGPAKGAGQAYGVKGGAGGRMPNGPERDKYIADKAAAAEHAKAMLYDIMQTSENEMTRISAANSLLDRVEGKSIQRVAATPGGETVEELRTVDVEKLSLEERDALRRAITQAKEAG